LQLQLTVSLEHTSDCSIRVFPFLQTYSVGALLLLHPNTACTIFQSLQLYIYPDHMIYSISVVKIPKTVTHCIHYQSWPISRKFTCCSYKSSALIHIVEHSRTKNLKHRKKYVHMPAVSQDNFIIIHTIWNAKISTINE